MYLFIAKAGVRTGPYSIEDLKILVKRGEVSVSDNVWHEGCAEWKAISKMPDLVSAALPPLPVEVSVLTETGNFNAKGLSSDGEMLATTKPNSENLRKPSKVLLWFWPEDRVGKTATLILALPICGLAVLLLCLGAWRGLVYFSLFVAGIATIGWTWHLINEWAGPRLFALGRNHVGFTGLLFLAGGMITVAVSIILGVIMTGYIIDGEISSPRIIPLALIPIMLNYGCRCLRLGWQGIAACKRSAAQSFSKSRKG